MLPEHLSADLCSLKEGELRETFAVEIFFNSGGHKTKHRFIRGKMRSAAKLSYRQAQDAIDGNPDDKAQPLLEPVLKPLWAAYRTISKARDQRAPLDLDLPERRVRIGEDGKIVSISLRERFDAHRLIEEFMIQANVAAAETLEQMQSPVVYRVHDTPSEAKIAAFAEFLQTLDMKWTVGERPQTHKFNKLLAEIRGGDYEGMIQQMVLRSQAQAIYSEENLGHFGLNLQRYSHFTSPIRRYADLVVHRALITAHDFGPDGLSERSAARLEEIEVVGQARQARLRHEHVGHEGVTVELRERRTAARRAVGKQRKRCEHPHRGPAAPHVGHPQDGRRAAAERRHAEGARRGVHERRRIGRATEGGIVGRIGKPRELHPGHARHWRERSGRKIPVTNHGGVGRRAEEHARHKADGRKPSHPCEADASTRRVHAFTRLAKRA
jgi:hypothetical protein